MTSEAPTISLDPDVSEAPPAAETPLAELGRAGTSEGQDKMKSYRRVTEKRRVGRMLATVTIYLLLEK